jgi:hypothetical protein
MIIKIWKIHFIYSCINYDVLSIYKSYVWIKKFQRMAIEMLFKHKIQIVFELNVHFSKIFFKKKLFKEIYE